MPDQDGNLIPGDIDPSTGEPIPFPEPQPEPPVVEPPAGEPTDPPVDPPVDPADPVDPPVDPVDPPAPASRTLGQDAEELKAAQDAAKASADGLAAYRAEAAARTAELEAKASQDAEQLAREKSEFAADLKLVGKTLVTKIDGGQYRLQYIVPGSDVITEEIGVGPETVVPEGAPAV